MKVLLATRDFERDFREVYPDLEVVRLPLREKIEADLLIFTGGEDLDPSMYSSRIEPYTFSNRARDELEQNIYYYNREGVINIKKILGVCRGLQFLNVMNGGRLHQDLPILGKGHKYAHEIEWSDSVSPLLSHMTMVNSMHHQAISRIGNNKRYHILAVEPKTDVIEAILWGDDQLGVQFHPEFMSDEPRDKFFSAIERWVEGEELVRGSRASSRRKTSKEEFMERMKYTTDDVIRATSWMTTSTNIANPVPVEDPTVLHDDIEDLFMDDEDE